MSPAHRNHVSRNRLLSSLEGVASDRFFSSLEVVSLEKGAMLYESDMAMRCAYFPISSLVSLVYMMQDGSTNEIAIIGNDGVVGVPLYMGRDTTTSKAMVRCAGQGFRLQAPLLVDEFQRSAEVQRVLLNYAQSLCAQISQIAACNCHHAISQQLSRWLLSSADKLGSDALETTHEAIAAMLGVRRESITKEAGELQDSGCIRYTRGHVTILDRPGLEQRACECYRSCLSGELMAGRSVSPRALATSCHGERFASPSLRAQRIFALS